MRPAVLFVWLATLTCLGCGAPIQVEERPAPEVFAYPAPDVAAELSVLETLIQSERFHRFVSLAQRTGHFETLRDADPLVVIAPVDEAFDRMSRGAYIALLEDKHRLSALIGAHIITGDDGPRPLRRVDRTLVAQHAIRCANGYVLVVDQVRPPPPEAR